MTEDRRLQEGMSPRREGKGMSGGEEQRGMSPQASAAKRPAAAPPKPSDASNARPKQ
jgi:hypothetical protein